MEFGTELDRAINAKVIALYKEARYQSIEGVTEMIPTFRSLLVQFDPRLTSPGDLEDKFLALLSGLDVEHTPGRRWVLPVCYEGEFGPDLDDVAKQTGLTPREVWQTHSSETYFIYMIGFLPGYGYMGDVPEAIRVPRRKEPRTRVPRGSVAIATDMTAIYSLESPGGWNLIGRTPVPLFNPTAQEPVLLAPGDHVVFDPVSRQAFAAIERDVAAGAHVLEAEAIL